MFEAAQRGGLFLSGAGSSGKLSLVISGESLLHCHRGKTQSQCAIVDEACPGLIYI
ncbi:MAG: hypothetical protein QM579_09590 [Desulfovibrio sp.]|uniref:hypothetical protein n=1 Tax=Desulfovibrio sp. TaxID=885 RepID=UPI0039E5ADBB